MIASLSGKAVIHMVRFWQEGNEHAGQCPNMKRLLRILGTDFVMEILLQLDRGEMAVNELANVLELPGDCITRHLKLLHSVSMVDVTRRKQFHIYCLGQGVQVRAKEQHFHITAMTADGSELSLKIPCKPIQVRSTISCSEREPL